MRRVKRGSYASGTGCPSPPPAPRPPLSPSPQSPRALTASRAPPGSSPPPAYRAGEGEGCGTSGAMEEAPASVPFLPPSPPSAPPEAAEVQPAGGAGADAPAPDGDAPQALISDDPPTTRGRGGWGSDAPCRPCATRTGPPRASHAGGTGGAALLLPAPRGTHLTGGSGGRCAAAHAIWDGRLVCALPPPPPLRGGAATTTMGWGARSGGAPRRRPQDAWGARDGAMGEQRGRTPDPGRLVTPARGHSLTCFVVHWGVKPERRLLRVLPRRVWGGGVYALHPQSHTST